MQQLHNLINCRNVGAAAVKGHVNEVEDFLEFITSCHICAVVMHYFRMNRVDDQPHSSVFPLNITTLHYYYLWIRGGPCCQLAFTIILKGMSYPKYMHLRMYPMVTQWMKWLLTILILSEYIRNRAIHIEATEPEIWHIPPCITQTSSRRNVSESVKQIAVDGVFNYAAAVLNDGLLLLEFKDPI